MMVMTNAQLFACLRYHDADRALRFLHALGFEEHLVVRRDADPTIIEHAQLRWRDNGGVMLGSVRTDDREFTIHPGMACTNLVVATAAEVDEVVVKGMAAGGTLVQEPNEPPYGGRSAMVRDPEGNLWNIDSYPGE